MDAEFFIVPFINILLSNILLLMIAGFAQTYIFDSETRKYIKINDQTSLLLTKLKDSNKEEYLKLRFGMTKEEYLKKAFKMLLEGAV